MKYEIQTKIYKQYLAWLISGHLYNHMSKIIFNFRVKHNLTVRRIFPTRISKGFSQAPLPELKSRVLLPYDVTNSSQNLKPSSYSAKLLSLSL